jgi:hypothetical protein
MVAMWAWSAATEALPFFACLRHFFGIEAMGFAVHMSGPPGEHTARSKLRTLYLEAPAAVWFTSSCKYMF